MRGRKPKPPELKIAECERPDRINHAAPRKLEGIEKPPSHLDAAAKKEWKRFSADLEKAGVLSKTDWSALAVYCQTYSLWVEAEREIAKTGAVYINKQTGSQHRSAWVLVSQQAKLLLTRLLTEFGCTPSARHRVSAIGAGDGGADELDQFLAEKKA